MIVVAADLKASSSVVHLAVGALYRAVFLAVQSSLSPFVTRSFF